MVDRRLDVAVVGVVVLVLDREDARCRTPRRARPRRRPGSRAGSTRRGRRPRRPPSACARGSRSRSSRAGTPRRGARRAAARARSARGSRRAPASAGRPTRSAVTPSEASARSFTSCRCVVAIRFLSSSVSGGETRRRLRRASRRSCLRCSHSTQAGVVDSGAGVVVPASQVSTAPRSSGSRRRRSAKASSSSSTPKPRAELAERRSWFSSRMP